MYTRRASSIDNRVSFYLTLDRIEHRRTRRELYRRSNTQFHSLPTIDAVPTNDKCISMDGIQSVTS